MLDKQFESTGTLSATFSGLAQRFRAIYGIPNIIRAQHNNPKGNLRLKDPKLNYPMGWFKVTTISYAEDQSTAKPKNVGRFGSGHSVGMKGGATNAVLNQNYYFPVMLNVAMTMRFIDEASAQAFIQRAIVASITESLTFNISTPTTKFNVRVLLDGNSMQYPEVPDLDDGTSDKGIIEIEMSYVVYTKIGFALETAKINNEGIVQLATSVKGDTYVQQNEI